MVSLKLNPPAGLIQKFLQSFRPDTGIGMQVSFQDVPQALDSRSCLELALTISVSSLIHNTMCIKFFALIIASPEISVDLSPFEDIISNKLSASCYVS